LKEIATRYVSNIIIAAALAGSVAGCADPYYPRDGYSQASYYPSGYSYPSSNSSYGPSAYTYHPSSYSYSSYPQPTYYRSSTWDNGYAYRNYNGIHPGPEQTYP